MRCWPSFGGCGLAWLAAGRLWRLLARMARCWRFALLAALAAAGSPGSLLALRAAGRLLAAAFSHGWRFALLAAFGGCARFVSPLGQPPKDWTGLRGFRLGLALGSLLGNAHSGEQD